MTTISEGRFLGYPADIQSTTTTCGIEAGQSNVFEFEIFESVVLGLKLPNYKMNNIKGIR